MHGRETTRLLLRPWTQAYRENWARILADPAVVRFISGGEPYSREEAFENSERSERLWKDYGFGPWAVINKATGRWMGRIGLNLLEDWPGSDRWEVGWELDPACWGQGFATEGGREAVRYGFQSAGLERIISATVPEHVASRRVMEKCGLSYQGRVGFRGQEVVWYAIDRDAYVAR
jgi:RimJ/RimL family protein N-acetyltransferase